MPKSQRYVSSELTHFVGAALDTQEEQYDLLKQIVRSQILARPDYSPVLGLQLTVDYSASICQDMMFSPQIVCFCDIPVPDLDIHMQKYSHFGIAFDKPFLVQRGATPVFYIAKNSADPSVQTRCAYFDAQLIEYDRLMTQFGDQLSLTRDFEAHRRFIDLRRFLEFGVFSFVKFFDDAVADDDETNYYMEREWRVLGGITFQVDDIARVILPKPFARRFRTDVPEYCGQLTFVG